MYVLFSLNELNLFKAIYLSWRGRKVCVIDVDPYMRASMGLLSTILRKLHSAGLVLDNHDACPDLKRLLAEEFIRNVYVDHRVIIDLCAELYHHERWLAPLGDYAEAYRQNCLHYVLYRASALALVLHMEKMGTCISDAYVSKEFSILYARLTTAETKIVIHQAPRLPNLLFNVISVLPALCVAVLTTLTRIRRRPAAIRQAMVMSQALSNEPSLFNLWPHALNKNDDFIVIFKNSKTREEFRSVMHDGFQSALASEIIMSPTQGLRAVTAIIGDTLRIARACIAVPGHVFWRMIILPWKRMSYRAMFGQIRAKAYFAYDEYSDEHLIRTQELRRAGILSMGQIHGLPSTQVVSAYNRYTNFDYLYVISRHTFTASMKLWPERMMVRGAPTDYLTKASQLAIKTDRPRDITVYINTGLHEKAMADLILGLATAFPERRIYVSRKPGERFLDSCARIIATTKDALPNIEHSTAGSFILMERSVYCFADISTISIEAIQMGMLSFVLDPEPKVPHLDLRLFPDLCVADANDAVRRIRAVEAEEWTYPRQTYLDLMGLAGNSRAEIIRADLGLPTRESQP